MQAHDPMIAVEGLGRRYGRSWALDDVRFSVDAGSVCGILGPNGAGKSTLVRILATLLLPNRGRAAIAGYDVVRQASKVRELISLAGQYAAVDEVLTGRANLLMVGRLRHLTSRAARSQAGDLLARFGLTEAANRMVKTYSGGMRRKLDLAASLVGAPRVLFLDEPTTGLDPAARNDMWEAIHTLATQGTTVLLTTQYLEEADRLANQIIILDRGKIIGAGTPTELKALIGGDWLVVVARDTAQLPDVQATLARITDKDAVVEWEDRRVSVPVSAGADDLIAAVRAFDASGIAIADVGLRHPTLDDVFLRLTRSDAPAPHSAPATEEVA